MKTPIFLLGTILVAAPCAFGQTAPVALAVPVATDAATAPDSDGELQAKVNAAAQALAKLPANTAGLVAAQERVSKARELAVVPVGFSIGQSSRQAHLVVDNLRSARVWCQSRLNVAKTDDKILLNEAIELLQKADTAAQMKVEILEKPDGRTTEKILADADKALAESHKNDALDAQLLVEGNELVKSLDKFRALLDVKDNFPPPPSEAEIAALTEMSNRTLRKSEATRDAFSSLNAFNEADEKANRLNESYDRKIDEFVALKKALANPALKNAEKQQAEKKLKQAVAEMDQAELSYLQDRKVADQHLKDYWDAKKREASSQLTLNPMSGKRDFPLSGTQGFLNVDFRFIQNDQQNLDDLKKRRDDALQDKRQAEKNYKRVDDDAKPTIKEYNAKVSELAQNVKEADAAYKNTPAEKIAAGAAYYLAKVLADRKLMDLPEGLRPAFEAYNAAVVAKEAAQKKLEQAKLALDLTKTNQCPTPERLKELQDAVTAAQTALNDAETALTIARTTYESFLAGTTEENRKFADELDKLIKDMSEKKAAYEAAMAKEYAKRDEWLFALDRQKKFDSSLLAGNYEQKTEDLATFLKSKTAAQVTYDAAQKAYKDAGGRDEDITTLTPILPT